MPQIRGNAHSGENMNYCQKHNHSYSELCIYCIHEMNKLDAEVNIQHTFPLTKQEAELIFDELKNHWFSRDHPHYHYSSSLMERLGRFVGK